MSYGRYRSRIFGKGLGNFTVRELSPSVGSAFLHTGYLDRTDLKDLIEIEVVKDEHGDVIRMLELSQEARFITNLKQTGIDEINLLRSAGGKLYAVRYYGTTKENIWQYFCAETGNIMPGVELPFGKNARMLALNFLCHNISDDMGFTVPLYYLYQADAEINVENLLCWLSPRLGYNSASAKVLDISGFANHGALSAGYATIWQTGTTPERFLRFDGVDDYCNLGDICDITSTHDVLIEIWARIQANNATSTCIMSKYASAVGYEIYRTSANKIQFRLFDGVTEHIAAIISTTTTLQNVWKHIAIALDRNGYGQIYINGVADGDPILVSSVGDSSNAENLYIAREVTDYGKLDKDNFRFHDYGAGGLPSDIATIIANNYAAEKGFYGL